MDGVLQRHISVYRSISPYLVFLGDSSAIHHSAYLIGMYAYINVFPLKYSVEFEVYRSPPHPLSTMLVSQLRVKVGASVRVSSPRSLHCRAIPLIPSVHVFAQDMIFMCAMYW